MREIAISARAIAIAASGSVVEAAVVAALTHTLGPQLATVAGATAGAATEEISNVVAQFFEDRRRRSTQMIMVAADYSDQDAEELVQRLLGTELTRELLHRAIQAAAQATTESKIRTLAHALASGAIAGDGAAVDESLIVIDAVGQLEAPHLRLLEILTELPDDPAVDNYYNLRPWPWRLQQIVDADPNLGNAFDALLAKLTALGMVQRFGAGLIDYAEDRIHLSRFGEICMSHLLETGSEHAE